MVVMVKAVAVEWNGKGECGGGMGRIGDRGSGDSSGGDSKGGGGEPDKRRGVCVDRIW